MKWLTLQRAVASANLSLTSEELIEYTLQSEEQETIEERFQKVGLLFDRDRWQANKPYLALLSPANIQKKVAKQPSNSATDSDLINDETSAEEDEENTVTEPEELNNAQSQQQEEPYNFEQCTIELHLTFKPDNGHPDGRIVIISASSHGDFPIGEKIRASALGELPPPVQTLFKELVADFPNRQARRQMANIRNPKKANSNPNQPPTNEASQTVKSETSTQPKTTGNQLSLF
ncbi:hypothetical protein L2E68_22505 [Planktothrix agardhii 1029]|jgi:hypothetical protein|uniref:Uncharacterized protein n=1 Tax=Planktothrix agardhii (strain NIVA-CYA 126/8) TaxID=388467 RepID=A0A073CMU9_PLAA1|nr:hypothetical protein [Planktothrix agardhii]KEI65280.1 hypothetical protein A19Y_9084 [Planktothrix agardhii NIVA-CYA 126/8]MCB8766623.1 hypothetical protein [Planktothrix agardhii 1809]MCB8780128.1 hypothetical protein [Planktothrix agardhii 1031]MCB8784526.1 hypothetical protein [Planktothrix agardhii 1808]MCF3568824.1 hypothetical protein [Planktothrix agardhii 1807]